MTTIRKIVTSQVDGNEANADVDNEIRPFGEAGFYIENMGGNTDKLVLSMFEGQRTHLRSKVLSPGIFYGSNADSGDGVGLDTIKLIPDTSLHYNDGNYGNDQYLIVDPTAPNHIHIRAGGTIDNSSADLFIGGEKNFVRVSDNSDDVLISTDDNNDGTKSWTFNSNGDLYVPNYIIFRDGTLIGDEGGATPPVFRIDAPLGFGINFTTDSDIEGANKVWSLGIDGSLTFPDNTVQNTAWAGGRIVNPPTTSKGAAGDLSGDLAFDDSYIYRCTANYAVISYNTALSRETINSNVFYIPDFDEFQDPTGGTLQFNPDASGQIVNIISAEIDGTEWALTLDTNGSSGLGTPVKITLANSDIWRRIQWLGNPW